MMTKIPSIKDKIKDLIIKSINVEYLSESCQDKVQTGNHYQSLNLGGVQTKGFRTGREEFLDQLNFQGKKVLDLGSNLGEISRGIRARGAYLVDGFEYDSYFLEIARLVNAYNEVTRVSFYQRNINDPTIYNEQYDIVLAFSVFIYVSSVLDKIAAITDVFLVETHRLDDNLESVYLGPVTKHFPVYKILGQTEWGTNVDESVKRVVIVFAKSESALAAAFKVPVSQTNSTDFASTIQVNQQQTSNGGGLYIDVRRTGWYDKFFSTLGFHSVEELLAAVDSIELKIEPLTKSYDLTGKVLSGWIYWLLYIKGYLQYKAAGKIDDNNIYFEYLTKYFGPQGHDSGLIAVLADPIRAAERITKRFQDFDLFRANAEQSGETLKIDPITLIFRNPPTTDARFVYEFGSDFTLQAIIDGYHRLFLARLFGVDSIRCKCFVPHNTFRFHIDDAGFKNELKCGTINFFSGWAINTDENPITHIRFSSQTDYLGTIPLNRKRPDLGEAFYNKNTGFYGVINIPEIYLGSILKVEAVSADGQSFYMDEYLLKTSLSERDKAFRRENGLPDDLLMHLVVHKVNPEAFLLEGKSGMELILGILAQHQIEISKISKLLDFGVGCGRIFRWWQPYSKDIEMYGTDINNSLIEWCKKNLKFGKYSVNNLHPPLCYENSQFDLIYAFSVFTHLRAETQEEWLAEFNRILNPGKYLLISVHGEHHAKSLPEISYKEYKEKGFVVLTDNAEGENICASYQSKDYSQRLFSKYFKILDYYPSALKSCGQQDLFLLQKSDS